MSEGGNRPGRAVEACTAAEMGTWSSPGLPKATALPVSSSVAMTNSRLASSRKSLLRPGREKNWVRIRSTPRLSNMPVGIALDNPATSRAGSCSRRGEIVGQTGQHQRRQRGEPVKIFPEGGTQQGGGSKNSPVSSLNRIRTSLSGEMPLASAEAITAPELTPHRYRPARNAAP